MVRRQALRLRVQPSGADVRLDEAEVVCTLAETLALFGQKPLRISQALSHCGALLCEEKCPVPVALHGRSSEFPDPHMGCREICLADALSDPLKHLPGLLVGDLHRLLRLPGGLLDLLLG